MAFSQRPQIILNDTDRHRLDAIIAAPTSPQKHVWRARMILELGAGCGLAETLRRTVSQSPLSGAGGIASSWRAWTGCCATARTDGASRRFRRIR